MALDTRNKRAAAAHIKRLAKGVTPDTTPAELWRASVGWSYAFDGAPPPAAGVLQDKFTLGTEESLSVTSQPTVGGRWSW